MAGTGRKILYFLGAGSSYGAGATTIVRGGHTLPIPMQASFWPTLLRFAKVPRRKRLESFLFRYFKGNERVPARMTSVKRRDALKSIDVEEVFTFLSERVRSPAVSSQLRQYAREIWLDLVTEIGTMFRRYGPNTETRRIYRALRDNQIRSRDAVVSWNYDTVFEDSLRSGEKWAYAAIQKTTGRLRVLKPHGSVNWYESKGGILVGQRPEAPVIVAPTHLKFVATSDLDRADTGLPGHLDQVGQVTEIWEQMEIQMREAKAFVFIGYSFPAADLYFSSVLRTALSIRKSPPAVVLVNPDARVIERELSRRFPIQSTTNYFDLGSFAEVSRKQLLVRIGLQ
jgi:hypothetical protein